MASINSVVLVGNLTRDPELRQTPGGTSVCNMRIAVNDRGKDSSGNWTDVPYYFDVTVWGNQAESCSEFLSKGKKVGIQGKLTWREWEMKDGGGKRQAVEITAFSVQFLSPRDGDGGGGFGGGQSQQSSADYGAQGSSDYGAPTTRAGADDDIPF